MTEMIATKALDEELTKGEEFRRGWPVLLACSFGAGVGLSGLFNYNSGLFVKDLELAIGLTRTQFGIAQLLATLAVALSMPWVGLLVDRFGVRWPTAIGAAGLALTYALFGILVVSVSSYVILMICLGFLGASATTVSFTRAITSWFDKGRGLALGLTQAGIGLSGTLVPPLVAAVMTRYGWRAGYFTLAAVAAAGVVTAVLMLRTREDARAKVDPADTDAAFRAARRGGLFWLTFAAFAAMTLAFAGMLIHFVPIIRDMGLSPIAAAGFASLIGVSVLLSRLFVGWLADMVHAPWLAAGAAALGALGCIALATRDPAWITLAAIALGCAMGAEFDLLGYISARYFKLEIYGRVYAWFYGGVMIAAGVSPFWIGWLADTTGNYSLALYICAALSVVVIGLFLLLPKYRHGRSAVSATA